MLRMFLWHRQNEFKPFGDDLILLNIHCILETFENLATVIIAYISMVPPACSVMLTL